VRALLAGTGDVKTMSGEAGTLALFRGHWSPHRVTPVEGSQTRVNAVLSYARAPGHRLGAETYRLFYGRIPVASSHAPLGCNDGKRQESDMASTASPTHLPSIDPHLRQETGRELQATLIDLVDLSLVGKQLHWSVVGPAFRTLHLQLDELVDSWRALADTVAERAVAIGAFPDGQAPAVAARSEAGALAVGAIEDHEVVRELAHRIAEVSELARTRMDRLGELDAASQDVLVGVVRALEEQQWMVRAQLPLRG
jgi:starvation-inducible DNA-binding protein